MDYSKKHNISVYLTEEQLDKRIADHRAFPRGIRISGVHSEGIHFLYNRAGQADRAAHDD